MRPTRTRVAAPEAIEPGDGAVGAGEHGIGLFEVIAGTLIATLAVLGLAYSFGVGRGLIDRYQIARAALGEAQMMMDSLQTITPRTSLTDGSRPFVVGSTPAGLVVWNVVNVDDPADGLASDTPPDPDPVDMKRITVTVNWGLGGIPDNLSLTRLVFAK
jgi:hypothetical protein